MREDLVSLGERIAEQAAHLDAALYRLLADLRVFDQEGGWHQQGALSCAHWLSWRVGWTLGTARDRVRVANRLGELPQIARVLQLGKLSYSKVRAMTRVATADNEATLLVQAAHCTAAQLERLCRAYAMVRRHDKDASPQDDRDRRRVTRRDLDDGMVRIEAVLHPEEAALVWAALDGIAKQACRARTGAADVPGASVVRVLDVSAEASPAPVVEADVPAAAVSVGQAGGSAGSLVIPAVVHARSTEPAESDERLTDGSSEPPVKVGSTAGVSAEPSAEDDGVDGVSAESLADPGRWAGASTGVSAEPSSARTAALAGSLEGSAGGVDGTSVAVPARDGAVGPEQLAILEARWSRFLDQIGVLPGEVTEPVWDSSPRDEIESTCALPAATEVVPAPRSPRRSSPRAAPVFDRADALVAMAQQIVRGTSPNRSPIELVVTVPAATLRAGETEIIDPTDVAALADGTCISPHATRRLACDTGVVEIVEDERGMPLTIGRKTRTIPGSMKRAMLERDRQTCRFPGCTNRLFLEGHHIEHGAHGGETRLRNLVSTCSLHHRYVHEHGYTVERDADGEVHFRDAAGRVIEAVPAPAQPPDLGWPWIEANNAYLDITPATNECGWDGRPVSYGYVIDDLVLADGLM